MNQYFAEGEWRAVTLADRALWIFTSGTTGLPKAAGSAARRSARPLYDYCGEHPVPTR